MKRAHDLSFIQVHNYLAGNIEYLNVKMKNKEMKNNSYIPGFCLCSGWYALFL